MSSLPRPFHAALRRPALGLLAAVAALASATPASAETAQSASAFRDSIGVNAHPEYTGASGTVGTAYLNMPLATINQRLIDLGILHLRGGLCDTGSTCTAATSLTAQNRMATTSTARTDGLRIKWLIGAGKIGTSGQPSATDRGTRTVTAVTPTLAPFVDAFEGPNEPKVINAGGSQYIHPTDLTTVTDVQNALWAARNASSQFATTPVLSPPMSAPNVTSSLAPLASKTTVGAWHVYRGVDTPDNGVLDLQNLRVKPVPGDTTLSTCKVGTVYYYTVSACNTATFGAGKPAWLTETGYNQCTDKVSGINLVAYGLTPDLSAVYVPRLLFDAFRLGYPRSYLYELIDSNTPAADCRQAYTSNWGLLKYNTTLDPTPAYTALKNALGLVGDLGATPTTGTLPLTITQGGVAVPATDQRHLLLKKADGSFVLALWATNGFRRTNGTPDNHWIPTATQPSPPAIKTGVAVGVTGGSYDISEYRPLTGVTALQTKTAVNSVTSDLTYDVHLYKIKAH